MPNGKFDLKALEAMRDQKKKELAVLEQLIRISSRATQEVEGLLASSGLEGTSLMTAISANPIGLDAFMAASKGPYSGMRIGDATKAYLRSLPNRAATTREIADALQTGGITSTAKNFVPTIYSILVNTPGVKRGKDKLWHLDEK